MLRRFSPDFRTIFPHVRGALLPRRAPVWSPWSTNVEDPHKGTLRLTGRLREFRDSKELVLLVHGLGGSPSSLACEQGAIYFASQGVSTLSLALRGADRRGEDFYNIALTADIFAAIQSDALLPYESVYALGYSMGGYVALHAAHESDSTRLKAVAAVCTPLDLKATQVHIDSRRAALYRRWVLDGLIEIYRAVAKRKQVPTDVGLVRRIRSMHDWDRLTIAPRYGYSSPEDYYERLSIVPFQHRLRIPSLLVAVERDPVVPASTILPFLTTRPSSLCPGDKRHSLDTRWVRSGGHLAFGREVDLGLGCELGLEAQLLGWFRDVAIASSTPAVEYAPQSGAVPKS